MISGRGNELYCAGVHQLEPHQALSPLLQEHLVPVVTLMAD
jgi:hypothetical protein